MPHAAQAGTWHGDWLLSASGKGCSLTSKLDDGSLASMMLDSNGLLEVFAMSPKWRMGKGEKIRLDLRFSDGSHRYHENGRGTVINGTSGAYGRWDRQFHAKMLRNFSGASHVDITADGAGRLRFGLKGSADGIAALQRCAGNIILPGADTLTPDLKEMLQLGNATVGFDSRNWAFNRFDRNGGWTIALVDYDDDIVSYRMHYTFNRGMKGWVDIRQSSRGTCLSYWDRQNTCKRVEVF